MTPSAPTHRARTALAVFDAFDDAGVPWAVLRNHEDVHVDPGRDIDIAIAPVDVDRVGHVIARMAERLDWDLACRCRGHHEGTSFFLLRAGPDGLPVEQLEIHCTKVRWAGLTVVGEDAIVARRVRSGDVWTTTPADQATQLAAQLVLSGRLADLKPRYRAMLERCAVEDPDGLAAGWDAVVDDPRLATELATATRSAQLPALRRRLLRAVAARNLRRGRRARTVADALQAATAKVRAELAPRCGVVAVGSPAALARVRRLVAPMFLETVDLGTVARRRRHRTGARVTNHAGLVLATDDALPASLARVARVAAVDEGMSDRALKSAVVDAFAANHHTLHRSPS